MANALDYVMELQRQKEAKGKSESDSIQTALSNFVSGRQLRQNEQLNQINMLLAQAKFKEAESQSTLLNQFLKSSGGAGGVGGQPGGPLLTSATIGGVTLTNPQAKAQEEMAQVQARKTAELNINKQALKKQLTPILALESTIPRSDKGGVGRLMQGGKNLLSGFIQDDAIGENISTYQKEVDRVSPLIARTSGDVANIAVTERAMSKGIFPTLSDSKGTAAKKRAILTDLSNAIDSENPSAIKKNLDAQGIPYFDLEKNEWVNLSNDEGSQLEFNTLQEAEAANLPKGTAIKIGGRKAKVT